MITEIVIMAGLGLGFGILLAYASKKLKVQKNPLVKKVRDLLPGANCGACGLAGCDAFAEAVVAGKVPVTGCIPGQQEIADKISGILGKESEGIETRTQNQESETKKPTLKPVKVLLDLCIGCGLCMRKCPKQIIEMVDKKAIINHDKCIKCGLCINACPKKAIIRNES